MKIALAVLAALAMAVPAQARSSHHHKATAGEAVHGHTRGKAKRHKSRAEATEHGAKTRHGKKHHGQVADKAEAKHSRHHGRTHTAKARGSRHRHADTARHTSRKSRHRHMVRTHHISHHRVKSGHASTHGASPTYRTPHYDGAPETPGATGNSFNNAFKDIRPNGDNH